MEFRILGPLDVAGPEGPIAIDAGKVRALLQLLLLRANEVIPAERLVDTLWGVTPPESAEHAIEVYISRLRRALGADRIETRPPGYRIRVESGELDLHRFEALTAEARRSLDANDPAGAVRLFREAEALWRGPALADLRSSDRTRAEVTRLDELHLAETEARIDAMLAIGRHAELIPELEELVAGNPFRERLRGQHMLALYRSGRQVDALEVYQTARRALDEEMGLEPGPALQQLQMAILRQDAELDAADSTSISNGARRETAAEGGAPGRKAPPHPARRGRLAIATVGVLVLVFLAVAGRDLAGMLAGGRATPGSSAGSGGVPGPGQSPSPGPSGSLTPAEHRLLDQTPRAVRGDCRSVSVAEGAEGDVASLRCELPSIAEADEVWFDRFGSLDSLTVAFNDLAQESGASTDGCPDSPPAVERWGVPNVHEGRLLCYVADGTAWIVWSYESDRILARASRRADDGQALFRWWRETARFLR